MVNVISSRVNTEVNDKSKEHMNRNYDKHGELKANRVKLNEYLGVNFDFTKKSKVKINMGDCV